MAWLHSEKEFWVTRSRIPRGQESHPAVTRQDSSAVLGFEGMFILPEILQIAVVKLVITLSVLSAIFDIQ